MYLRSGGLAAVLALCSKTVADVPVDGHGQRGRSVTYDASSAQSQKRANAVKEAFQFAWDGYYQYAFPHDELHPVTNNFSDSRFMPTCQPKNTFLN